ncbi:MULTISPECIES: YadA family autotransporter adhesin [Paraburkholderia]|uniref:YadA family autotransporter adhesin n=1 Tax=Paraburkholderia TaxID=1822464 RepID=UPI0015C5282F|nr:MULTISPECIES: YadA-like family protein [Paraburkholderia]MCX4170390.1 YadA-like family protein [Paraburkholderia madseniana]MDQ6458402.1 YadA-like family protein [Paraburkholderia madseniana]NPT66202.1 hypothetical protein [Paraburkholderia madseniana]
MSKSHKNVSNKATGAQVAVSESTRPSGEKSRKVGGSTRAASTVSRLVGAGAAAAFLSGGAFAAEVCATGGDGKDAVSFGGGATVAVVSGCANNAYLPAGHDIAELEAGGSVVYADGTTNTVNFRAGSDGQIVSINSDGVIQNVGAGAVNSTSKDAVNGSELYANAASTAAALGGGAKVAADGTISAPTYSVDGKTVNNVGDAISNLDGRVAKNTTDIEKNTTEIEKNTADIADLNNTVVKYDSLEHDRVTLGGSANAQAVKLSNLQDGELSATSTDAVTGAQLSSTNQNLADLTQSVKSAMSVSTAGLPAPTSSGTNAVAFGGGAQASGDNSVAIGAGSVADQANTFSVGSQGNERRIVNVANGTQGTDAVNVNQLNEAKTQAKNYTDKIAKNAYAGVAAAMAMPNMTPSGPGKTVVAAGGGTYKGASAGAVGVTYRSQTGHWLANGAVSVTSTGDAGARAQVGYEF